MLRAGALHPAPWRGNAIPFHCINRPCGARVNLRAIGVGLQAIIRIQTTHAGIAPYVQLFQQMPEVLEADRVTGEDCFIVRCAIAQPADLERVVDALAVHGAVTTSLVLSSPVRKAVTVPA